MKDLIKCIWITPPLPIIDTLLHQTIILLVFWTGPKRTTQLHGRIKKMEI